MMADGCRTRVAPVIGKPSNSIQVTIYSKASLNVNYSHVNPSAMPETNNMNKKPTKVTAKQMADRNFNKTCRHLV